MSPANKLAAINKFRSNPAVAMRQPTTKALVVYDVQVKSAEVSQVPLVVNYGEFDPRCFLTQLIRYRFAESGRRIRAPSCSCYR